MDRDGWRFVLPCGFVAVILTVFAFSTGQPILHWSARLATALTAFFVFFFRDPRRHPPEGDDIIVSPGDGKVVDIHRDKDTTTVAIFLSLFDVHINRAPIAGYVKETTFWPGEFLQAFRPEAAKVNEQIEVTIIGKRRTITFRLIAGILARRIVCRVDEDVGLMLGERIGLIRFGSRVEVDIPKDMEIVIKKGDRVKGGESILAREGETSSHD